MVDPLAEVVAMLQPGMPFSKIVSGAGRWSVRRSDYGQPFYCVILEGGACMAVDGHAPITLRSGDFVLIPSALSFTLSDLDFSPLDDVAPSTPTLLNGEVRCGDQTGPPDVRFLVGYCVFGSKDAALLVSLLPQLVHVRGEKRLATLLHLVSEESREMRPARDVILARLLEVLLIEALRSTADTVASPSLLRGLADGRLAGAIRQIHASPGRAWTVALLAKEASLSRSAFFERFSRAVGVAPMAYLLAWRMALATDLLRRKEDGVATVATVAERVGYSSASTFTVAFTRHVGVPPARYAREQTGRRGPPS